MGFRATLNFRYNYSAWILVLLNTAAYDGSQPCLIQDNLLCRIQLF